jgi:hypothetical protein
MGGGSKSSQSSATTTTNYDDDVVVEGSGIGVGADGVYVAQSVDEGAMGLQIEGATIGDIIGSGAVNLGDNNAFALTAMDQNTRDTLDQAFTVVSANANNMMTLAAGRDANKPLADESNEIGAKTKAFVAANPAVIAGVIGAVAVGAVAVGAVFVLKKGKK